MTDTVDATAYLILEGMRNKWNANNPVYDARIVTSRKGKPAVLARDQVAVKVTVRVPKAAFEPLRPEALVVVPEELVQHAIEAVAGDAATDA